MKKILIIPIVFITAFLIPGGCATATTGDSSSPALSDVSVKSPYKGFGIGADEALVHLASGAVFEKNYGDFKMLTPEQASRIGMSSVVVYDKSATDVSVNYMWFPTLTLASIYVYPCRSGKADGQLLKTEFELCKQDVHNYKTVTAFVMEETIQFKISSGPITGHMAVFKTIEGGMPATSFVFLYGKNNWFVLYRVTIFDSYATEKNFETIIELSQAFDIEIIE